MRILMFTRFDTMGANSRYRLLQYVPLLEAAGHHVEVRPMLGSAYLQALYTTGSRSLPLTLRGYARRLSQLRGMSKFDVVVCDQEFLPYFPAGIETWIGRHCARLLVDYDDAAYVKYERLGTLRNRIPKLISVAEAVIVGNRCLAAYAARHNPNVHLIPTVVNTARYTAKQDYASRDGVSLVWIGTPVTAAAYLPLIADALRTLQTKYPDLRLTLIGAGDAVREILPFAEVVPWSDGSETRLLAACDVGLMPLPDNAFARGKCGLKLIQYMAAGLPVVGSPVGANCDIISEGKDGFLAERSEDWVRALERLIASADLRRELGRNGVTKVARQYSLQAGYNGWMRVLDPPPQAAIVSHNIATAVGS